ncbi:MAG: hypothetical protein R3Y65_00315 [Bacillota bacterium]
MDAQMLMLYILILINQIVAYGVLIYLAVGAEREKPSRKSTASGKSEKSQKNQVSGEEPEGKSGKYLDYINKFEVEA